MTDILLITPEEVMAYRPISEAVESSQLQPYIRSAQNLDIKQALGNPFFTDLITNRTAEKYKLLISGGNYAYNGKTYSFEGMKAALAFFTTSRYILSRNVQDSPFGMMEKVNEFSRGVSTKRIEQESLMDRNAALAYMEAVYEFLRIKRLEGSSDYSLYTDSCESTDKPAGGFVLTKVGD